MPSTYTTSLRLEKPADGEQSTTWGDTIDRQLDLIDLAIAGVTELTIGGGTVTLTTNNGVDDQARRAVLVLQGTLSSNATIVFPPVSKVLFIDNQLVGNFTVTYQISGGSGASVTLPPGWGGTLFTDGVGFNILSATQAFQSIGLQGTLYCGAGSPVFSGQPGTQLSSGAVQIASAAGSPPLLLSSPLPGPGLSSTLIGFYAGAPTSFVGFISTDGGSTSYNTTSDYRAKGGLRRLRDAIGRFVRLKVYRGHMKRNRRRTIDMMLAHEIALVVPEAVTGEKDATDDQGRPVLQMVDASKLMPLTVATLLEVIARQDEHERRLARLEVAA